MYFAAKQLDQIELKIETHITNYNKMQHNTDALFSTINAHSDIARAELIVYNVAYNHIKDKIKRIIVSTMILMVIAAIVATVVCLFVPFKYYVVSYGGMSGLCIFIAIIQIYRIRKLTNKMNTTADNQDYEALIDSDSDIIKICMYNVMLDEAHHIGNKMLETHSKYRI